MFDATKLLGSFLQNRQGGSSFGSPGGSQGGGIGGLVQQAISQFGGSGGGAGGGLGALVSQFTGGARPGAAQAPAGAPGGSGFMDQVSALTRRAVNAPGDELRNNNPAAVAGLGALAGALMGGGRGALGGGALAVLGSLAYTAWQQGAPPAAGTAPGTTPRPAATPLQAYADPEAVQRKARLVLHAMIQAAKADGQLDDAERERLTRHVGESGDAAEAQAFLDAEMAGPVDIPGLAAEVRSPEEAAEIYGASVMAISIDTQAERDYLARLAAALKLPEGVVAHVHASLNQKA